APAAPGQTPTTQRATTTRNRTEPAPARTTPAQCADLHPASSPRISNTTTPSSPRGIATGAIPRIDESEGADKASTIAIAGGKAKKLPAQKKKRIAATTTAEGLRATISCTSSR